LLMKHRCVVPLMFRIVSSIISSNLEHRGSTLSEHRL
jgi:hypothetical protein